MKAVILGGGISGLSAAWYLRKKHPEAQIVLLEKEDRLGGWIRSSREGGFFFEKGPRTFQASRCPNLLSLIQETGLEQELIYSSPYAAKRYVWSGGRLRSIASFFPSLVISLMQEPFIAKGTAYDESIYDFASRRLGSRIAETLVDAMTLGIYGGDIRRLSMRSCFPSLFRWEREYGSLVAGMLRTKKKGEAKGLFTLRDGIGRLIEKLADGARADIRLGNRVEAIAPGGVVANGVFHSGDLMISALPCSEVGALTGFWDDFYEADLSVVNLAYGGDVLSKKGFGYLVPTQEKENLLGMIWDSAVFSQQNKLGETRVTAMMREGSIAGALDVMKRHLGIFQDPVLASCFVAKKAIPQCEVGHSQRLERFQAMVKQRFPSLVLIGNYVQGASVEACVALAKQLIGSRASPRSLS